MKTIRFFASLLMLISGVWHVALYFKAPAVWGITALAFGILYLIIGLLLLRPKMIGVYLGLIPVVPLISAPFMVKLKDLDPAMTALLLIDLVVFVCCVYLLLKRNKAKA
jgi:hypothetical protein